VGEGVAAARRQDQSADVRTNRRTHLSSLPSSIWHRNGDGKADVCGRAGDGIHCAASTGTSFGAQSLWQNAYSDHNLWNLPQYYSTINYVDVNGDGKADVCGRNGVGVACALSSGTTFGAATQWDTAFSDANGWNAALYYSTLAYPDLNDDGKVDVCGRAFSGIACVVSNGTSFGAASIWSSFFGNSNGWANDPSYYSTIKFADLNGDGMADVCGRESFGVDCALSNGSTFGTASNWSSYFTDALGWASLQYYSTIQFGDINGDRLADICGRGGDGVHCALSNGSSFGTQSLWQSFFSDANGWSGSLYYSTIRLVDVNNDGKADVCSRGSDGIDCGLSNGTSFGVVTQWQPSFSNANGWTAPQYDSTISYPHVVATP
jgi:hypothetical protein